MWKKQTAHESDQNIPEHCKYHIVTHMWKSREQKSHYHIFPAR